MADRLDRYRSKRDFATTPEPGGDAPAAEEARNRFVVQEHHARAAALGPAARARRRARLVGGPEGHPARPGQAQPPGRPHRGPPARVPRVLGRHPGRPVRRRHDEDLGPRDLRDAQVPRQGGDGHLPRRAPARPLRPVPDPRRRLDDPPHGSARGSGARADAGAAAADARAHGHAPRATTASGRTRSSGTACARSATSTAGGCGSRAATATTSRRATRSCAGSGRSSARATRSSTARSSRSTPAARRSRSSRAACT